MDKTNSLGGYRFDLYVEDIDLWWRMALRYDIRLIPAATVGFRQHPQSVSSANLEAQALNTLYVQYLLLSHLWNRDPLCYREACEALSCICDRRRLDFKTRLRSSNMEMGQGHVCSGLREAGRAFMASPKHFIRRLLDEFVPNRLIGSGEPPACFVELASILWRAGSDVSSESASSRADSSDCVNGIQLAGSVSERVR